ncbi:hypothetical protein SNK03_007022 [Fusarium graminearum]
MKKKNLALVLLRIVDTPYDEMMLDPDNDQSNHKCITMSRYKLSNAYDNVQSVHNGDKDAPLTYDDDVASTYSEAIQSPNRNDLGSPDVLQLQAETAINNNRHSWSYPIQIV